MTGFYNFLDKIKEALESSNFVNTVTYGDITRIDLNKTTNFPLSHFVVNNISYGESTLTYNVSLLCMDIVNESDSDTVDLFVGNDNEHDIFNTQQDVIISVLDNLLLGDLYISKYQLAEGSTNIEPFVDRFENRLAGWVATFDVLIVNDRSCE